MHDAVAMRVVERGGDLHRIRKCLVHRHSAGRQSSGECFAAEILHHEEIDLVLTPDVVERADVWVGECGHGPCFSREPRAHRRIYRDAARQHLDRNKAIEAGIGGAEDLTHATSAEQSLDAVRAKGRAGDQVQTFIEDRCRSRPHRVIQDDARIVLAQQRRDLVAERFIARAGLGEKRVARGRVLLDGQLVDSGDGLPALGSHVHADLLAIGKRCARRVVSGRERTSQTELRQAGLWSCRRVASPRKAENSTQNYNALMSPPNSADITGLLKAWGRGDQTALDELTPLVYTQLRAQARRYMRRERSTVTLEGTGLVHEAFLRLVRVRDVDWQDRAHFFALSAQIMRRILVDSARARCAEKRGGGAREHSSAIDFDRMPSADSDRASSLCALEDALGTLAQFDARRAKVIELRFFGGLSVQETADVLQVSPQTVMRDWRLARAWLARALRGEAPA